MENVDFYFCFLGIKFNFHWHVINILSSKKQHSRRARQGATMEEGFSSVTRIMANVFFSTHVVLTVHRSVQTVVGHMDSMPT